MNKCFFPSPSPFSFISPSSLFPLLFFYSHFFSESSQILSLWFDFLSIFFPFFYFYFYFHSFFFLCFHFTSCIYGQFIVLRLNQLSVFPTHSLPFSLSLSFPTGCGLFLLKSHFYEILSEMKLSLLLREKRDERRRSKKMRKEK